MQVSANSPPAARRDIATLSRCLITDHYAIGSNAAANFLLLVYVVLLQHCNSHLLPYHRLLHNREQCSGQFPTPRTRHFTATLTCCHITDYCIIGSNAAANFLLLLELHVILLQLSLATSSQTTTQQGAMQRKVSYN